MFAQKLRELRLSHGLTQAEMAARLCMSQSAYSRLEHNEHPQRHHIERINHEFGVDTCKWLAPSDDDHAPAKSEGIRVVHLSIAPNPSNDDFDDRWVDRFARDLKRVLRILRGGDSRGGGGGK